MSLPYQVTVDAEVNPEDVLKELCNEDIVSYLKKQRVFIEEKACTEFDAMDYYHGDFDLKAILKEIGMDEVRKVVKEIEEENVVCIN